MKRYYINPDLKRASFETRRTKSKDKIDFETMLFANASWTTLQDVQTYPSLHFTPVVYRHLLFIWAPVSQNRVTNFFNKVSNESVTRDIAFCSLFLPSSFLLLFSSSFPLSLSLSLSLSLAKLSITLLSERFSHTKIWRTTFLFVINM